MRSASVVSSTEPVDKGMILPGVLVDVFSSPEDVRGEWSKEHSVWVFAFCLESAGSDVIRDSVG